MSAQDWEKDWWGSCQNTYGEEEKQLVYASKMGLKFFHDGKSPYNIDMQGKSVLDIGGGPSSLLLKCRNVIGHIIDPLEFPLWVDTRYEEAKILVYHLPAEVALYPAVDEVWIYNCLQHCENPQEVVRRAVKAGKLIRIFEWIDTPANEGHPQSLSEAKLNEWLGGVGRMETLNTPTLKGKCYYGVFDQVAAPTISVPKKLRFHIPAYVHLPCSEKYMGCAFTQKIVKLSKMLLSLGHEVFIYGAEESDTPCTEFIQTHSLKDIRDAWGDVGNSEGLGYDWRSGQFRHDFNAVKTPTTMKFYQNCIAEINKRKQPDDFLLVMQGYYHKPIADAVKLWLTCEPGVGYRGSYARFKAFESAYLMNFTYGGDFGKASINGNYYDRVIPNYFDPKDFPFVAEKQDYFFCIGRMIIRKGVWTAVEATRAIGAKLYLAGQIDPEIDIKSLPDHCTFLGYLEPKERSKWMGSARAVFVPTIYLEAFGGVNVEAQLCGTPVITTNFGVFPETVVNRVTGFRCDTLQDFVQAAKDVVNLNPSNIRLYAERYLMNNVKWDFEKWFRDLYQLYLSATVPGAKGWHYIKEEEKCPRKLSS